MRWRTLEDRDARDVELGEAPDVPPEIGVDGAPSSLQRRDLLKLMGASLALASGCAQSPPREEIVPAVDATRAAPVGVTKYYATASVRDGCATGILVETHEGRPTKIEGNPRHPASLGKSGAHEQALLLQLYDPSRARAVLENGTPSTFASFTSSLRAIVANHGRGGDGVHVAMPPTSSLVIEDAIAALRAQLPNVALHFVAPSQPANAWSARRVSRAAARFEPRFDLSRADVVVCLDSDPFTDARWGLRFSHDFAARRRATLPATATSMDASEATPRSLLFTCDEGASLASRNADRRVLVKPSRVVDIARALESGDAGSLRDGDRERAFVEQLQRALARAGGAVAIFVGERQPLEVHAIAAALHARLGSIGKTVTYAPSPIFEAGERSHDPALLFDALAAGAVDVLVTLDVNLAYHWPRAPLDRAKVRVHHALYVDETAAGARWFVPAAHALESWGDARAADGTVTPIQPVIEPLFAGRSSADVLEVLASSTKPGELISSPSPRTRLASSFAKRGFDLDAGLRAGFVANSAASPPSPSSSSSLPADFDWGGGGGGAGLGVGGSGSSSTGAIGGAPVLEHHARQPGAVELSVRTDVKIGNGEMSNNAWLLELPDPITKLTWENAALVGPRLAARLDLHDGDVVELQPASARVPVLVVPNLADDVVVIHDGWGRTAPSLALAHGLGFSAAAIVAEVGEDPFPTVEVVKQRGASHALATTQRHQKLDGDETVAVDVDFAALVVGEMPRALLPQKRPPLSLYEPPQHPGVPQWGMAIDLDACTGCSACVVACQAENNIPVVGKDGVLMHREMHWLRIDRYFDGDVDDAREIRQPMLCQHCEMAPCEYVCPVNATVHSDDGLNQMIYNRCVGTRFCSNNCPYKVRRFNWLNYTRDRSPLERLATNPDVTVRDRGVMEKCTYCVQRIRRVGEAAHLANRDIADGDVVTACAQSCPTDAIVFGRVDDPHSRVSQLAGDRRAYSALGDLGVRPRTRYLAKVRR